MAAFVVANFQLWKSAALLVYLIRTCMVLWYNSAINTGVSER